MAELPFRFLRIRFLQLIRELRSAGFFRAVILVLLFLAALYLFGFTQLQEKTAYLGIAAVVSALIAVHLSRNDSRFIAHVSVHPWKVYSMEYIAGSLLFAVTGFLLGSMQALLIIPVAVLAGFFPQPRRRSLSSGSISSRLPADLFEWKAGIRKSGIVLPALYLLAILCAPLPYVSLVWVWLMTGIISSFYLEGEARIMVEAFRMNEHSFIRHKLWRHLMAACVVLVAPLLIHLIFRPGEWLPVLVVSLMVMLNMVLFVVSKYAIWEPGSKGGANEMVFSFSLISVLIPFLLPLPGFFIIRNYYRSLQNLKPVLNDHY